MEDGDRGARLLAGGADPSAPSAGDARFIASSNGLVIMLSLYFVLRWVDSTFSTAQYSTGKRICPSIFLKGREGGGNTKTPKKIH